MNDEDLIDYFNQNLESIFTSDNFDQKLEFISFCIEDKRIQDLIKTWPNDIKIKIVQKYFLRHDLKDSEIIDEYSWSDYYEMYDGKFDEDNMLHITIKKENISEIISLGYKKQDVKENWHKPKAGQYKLDDNQNIIIIHSCPDIEIFGGDLKQHLEELGLKFEWTLDTTLSAI